MSVDRLARLASLYAGTASQERWLTVCGLGFYAIYAVYDLSYFYRVDLRHLAIHDDVFAFMPTGLLEHEPWFSLGSSPRLLAFVQYGFAVSCLVAAFTRTPSLVQRLVVLTLGYAHFAVLNGFFRESNIEFFAFLALLPFVTVPEAPHPSAPPGTRVFSPACFLSWLLLAGIYLNSGVIHLLHHERWLSSGVGLQNQFLIKLNYDVNWTPLGTSALMTSVVSGLPSWVFWLMGVSTLVFDMTFWLCLIHRPLRPYFLAVGVLFHVGTVFLMNIVWAPILPLYAGLIAFEWLDRRGRISVTNSGTRLVPERVRDGLSAEG
jgi:hypothetical protein